MTVKKLLSGDNVNFIQVNVLKELSQTQFIVGDNSGLVIMRLDENMEYHKQIEVGKGLKIMKPQKVTENVITCHKKFSPMKSRPIKMEVNDEEIKNIEEILSNTTHIDTGIPFLDIIDEYADNAIISDILAYITSVSRTIQGKYGDYQICNLKDNHGTSLTMNVYKQNVNKLEANKVYRLKKLKKTAIKSESGPRIATTNFTKTQDATYAEVKLFDNVQLGDAQVTGSCVMINNFHYYKSCKKHYTKLDEESQCTVCGDVVQQSGNMDFRCGLLMEDDDEKVVDITIFRRHLNIEIKEDEEEDTVVEQIEECIVGKRCKIDYNEAGDDDKVAIKVTTL